MSNENAKQTFSEFFITLAVWVSTAFGSMVVFVGCFVMLLWAYQTSIPALATMDTPEKMEFCLSLCCVLSVSTFLSVYIFAAHPAAFISFLWPVAYALKPIFWLLFGPVAIGAIAGYYLNRYTYHRQRQALKAGVDRNLWDLNLARVTLYIVMVIIAITLTRFDKYQHLGWIITSLIMAGQTAMFSLPSMCSVWIRTEALLRNPKTTTTAISGI